MTIRTFLDFLWFQVCVSQSLSASWVRRPSAASVVTITFRRSKKQAWRLDVHAHTGLYNLHLCFNQMSQWSMDTRELSSALRTHCCVRFCYFGSAELSRPYWLSSSFFAFELRLRRFEGARLTIWHSGPPICLWVLFKLLPLWHNWRRPSGLRRARGAGFFRSGQRHLPSWQALPYLSIPHLVEDNVEDIDSWSCVSLTGRFWKRMPGDNGAGN